MTRLYSHFIAILVLQTCLYVSPSFAADPTPPSRERIRLAVEKAIPLLEASGSTYRQQRECFSCHHQAVPLVALSAAKRHGFKIDDDEIQRQAEHTLADLATARETYAKGNSQGGGSTRAGYALWTLALAGIKPDETTNAVAHFLSVRDENSGHWRTSSRRPPSESSDFTSTFVALKALEAYGSNIPIEKREARIASAREWLASAEPKDTEDRVFQLLGLALARANEDRIGSAAKALIETQNADGGWAQNKDLQSDAYASATALYALVESGQCDEKSAVCLRALSYLLDQQQADGSWHVGTRSKPFQTYFESGFPFGKDQFISISATAWAVAVLATASDATNVRAKP